MYSKPTLLWLYATSLLPSSLKKGKSRAKSHIYSKDNSSEILRSSISLRISKEVV